MLLNTPIQNIPLTLKDTPKVIAKWAFKEIESNTKGAIKSNELIVITKHVASRAERPSQKQIE